MKFVLFFLAVFILVVGIGIVLIGNYDHTLRIGALGTYTDIGTTSDIDAYRAIEYAIQRLGTEEYAYELLRYDLTDYDDYGRLVRDLTKDKIDVIIGPCSSAGLVKVHDFFY